MARRTQFLSLLMLSLTAVSYAQPPSTSTPKATAKPLRGTTTLLGVELLTGADGGALHAQAWGRLLEDANVSFVIRRGREGDSPDLSEKTVGTLRHVTLVGRMTRSGDLEFPGRSYSRSDVRALKEWLTELQTYGMQGAPTGKPLWGLSQQQFELLYAALAVPCEEEVRDQPLPAAIELLKVPAEYPVRWSTEAETVFRSLERDNTARQPLKGFTKATAMAILLNDRGFGFRPNRTPNGSIELVVEPLSDTAADHWPVGWPPQSPVPQLVPGMFAMTPIEIVKTPVATVLKEAATATRTPILVDYHETDRRAIALGDVLVSFPIKRSTWSLALRAVLVPNKLTREYWQDEAGRGFVWVTPIGKPRPAITGGQPTPAP